MSKKNNSEETRTSIDNLNDSLAGLGEKAQKNMKKISIIGVIIAVIVVAILAYIFLVRKPAVKKQDNAIGQADREMLLSGNDSIALTMYEQVAEGGGAAANRAKLMSAIQLYNGGKYEEAIKYLDGYSNDDKVVEAAAYSLLGDCYVNLDKLPEAISAFKKAVSASDNNAFYTPIFMVKLAHIYHEQKNYADEAATYQEIFDKYPEYVSTSPVNVMKDLERAKILAGK